MNKPLTTKEVQAPVISRAKAAKYLFWARLSAKIFSKDPSTKVMAVYLAPDSFEVLALGYNGMPRGIDDSDPKRWERPLKYMRVEHAERNGLYNASRRGVEMRGAIAIVTLFPCADCARALIQSGIQAVVTTAPNMDDTRWDASFAISREMLLEVGIDLILITEEEVAFAAEASEIQL